MKRFTQYIRLWLIWLLVCLMVIPPVTGYGAAAGNAASRTSAAKSKTKKLKIAVASSSPGEAQMCVSMLKKVGANAVIVRKKVRISDYDGLVLPGGTDLNPALYHEKNKGSRGISKSLDKLQKDLLTQFVKARKPVLGVCRGCQLINVYFGGTLKQNIKKHRYVWHSTKITGGSVLADLYGKKLRVYSLHLQAVKRLGKDLQIIQKADDGTVEAIVHKKLPVIGVQWHPERMGNNGKILFKKFLGMCRKAGS